MTSSRCARSARSGFALVPVILLLSALLLVAMAFSDAVLQGLRSARLGWQGERATHEADAELLSTLASWNRDQAAALLPGETDTLSALIGDAVSGRVIRTRLHSRLFALESFATVREGGTRQARRTLGRTVRLEWPFPPVLAVLSVAGTVQALDGATVLGADAVPPDWLADCALDRRANPLSAVAADSVVVSAGAVLSGSGAPVRTLADSALSLMRAQFDSAYSAFVALATMSTSDSLLSLDERSPIAPNCPRWFGEGARTAGPPAACARRWPIVHAIHPGVTRLEGLTAAQGVLLIDGDLQIDQPVTVHGLVLVRGRLLLGTTPPLDPPRLTGAVVVRDAANAGSVVGRAVLQGSQCASRRALAAAGVPVPVQQHGWSERP